MQVNSAASLFQVLSVPKRLKILKYILSNVEPVPSSLIARVLDINDGQVSGHLTQLAEMGLVIRRPSGRWVFYSPNRVLLNELGSFLQQGETDDASPSTDGG